MSIIIKGMDMPKSCRECLMRVRCSDCVCCNDYCVFEPEEAEGWHCDEVPQTRPNWCPLVELPNTDLVDADTVEFWGEHEHGYRWTGKIVVHREKESDYETS